MLLLQGNGDLRPECSRDDFSDTPSAGPRDQAGSKNCADVSFTDSAGAFRVKSVCCDTRVPPMKNMNSPTKANTDKTAKNPFRGRQEVSFAGGSVAKSGV